MSEPLLNISDRDSSIATYGSINISERFPVIPTPAVEGRFHKTMPSAAASGPEVINSEARHKGDPIQLTLFLNGKLRGRSKRGKTLFEVNCADVVGVSTTRFMSLFVVHAYPQVKNKRKSVDYHFQVGSHEESVTWANAIRALAYNIPFDSPLPPPRRVAVMINPFGGTGKAVEIFQNQVRPLWERAGLEITVLVTRYAGHATDIGRTIDLDTVDILATVSGDGLMHETVQGIMQRSDWRRAVRTPLAVIPGGSGNALAAALKCIDPVTAAFAVAKGLPIPLDVMQIQQDNHIPRFAFLHVTWALISDVDIETEKLRWLGPLRFTLGALKAIASPKTYKGRLRFVPADTEGAALDSDFTSAHEPVTNMTAHIKRLSSQTPRCDVSSCDRCVPLPPEEVFGPARTIARAAEIISAVPASTEFPEDLTTQSSPAGAPPVFGSFQSFSTSTEALTPGSAASRSRRRIPTITNTPGTNIPPHAKWETVEADFIMFVASNVSHLSYDLVATPLAHMSDGTVDLIYVKAGVSRTQMLKLFLAAETGEHLAKDTEDVVQYRKVKAFTLEPLTSSGILSADGEAIPYEKIRVEVHRGLLRMMALPASL
eukprot:TRINITY_DN8256_c0_g1_i1.p1 TRINITY_DN8256_c0_g1~~TRINITY_DN8256_c0_g1_i1.p1  ORF type:complete len:600 (-),score=113.94 TRINITY_DN8256_c0_g1_i1:50-1849(-)